MEQKQIRVLIVDDNLEACDILENYFSLIDEITVCGVAHDGDEALYEVGHCQPDVMVLDLIMPKTDGLSVLERLRRAELPYKPRVIVTSAVGQESFTGAALKLGADYYMIKPYDLSDLCSRICMVASIPREKQAAPSPVAKQQEEGMPIVSRALLELGVPAHMLGYRYCCTAVLSLMQQTRPQSIVKDVYAKVAAEYDTTPECVETAIRKVIRRAWEQEPNAVRALIGEKGDKQEKPPANGRFLTVLAQRLLLPE